MTEAELGRDVIFRSGKLFLVCVEISVGVYSRFFDRSGMYVIDGFDQCLIYQWAIWVWAYSGKIPGAVKFYNCVVCFLK